MKKKTMHLMTGWFLALTLLTCQKSSLKISSQDRERVISEVEKTEGTFFTALREGRFLQALTMHYDSPDYQNVWSGNKRTVAIMSESFKQMEKVGLKIDFNIVKRDYKIIDISNIIETLTCTETLIAKDGYSETSGTIVISILWQQIDGQWRLGYIHGSELVKSPS